MKSTENFCSCCRTVKSNGQFYPSIGIQNQDRVPICKDCCKNKLDKYSAILGIDGGAWALMGELGIPYIADKWKTAQASVKANTTKGNGNIDPVSLYIKLLKNGEIVYQGFWDSDTMYDRISNKRNKEIILNQDDRTDLELMRKKWGKYDDPEAYDFLEETLFDYTENLLNMDANLLNRYKDLCRAEYAKYKAQESGDLTEQSRALDAVAKQLKLMKLDDFQDNKQSEIDKFIERKAWQIENTRPAECEDLNKYKDISNFESSWSHMFRSLRNLLAGTKDYPDIPKDVN